MTCAKPAQLRDMVNLMLAGRSRVDLKIPDSD